MSKFCRKCGAELSSGVQFCRRCGAPTGMIPLASPAAKSSGKGTHWAIAVLVAVVVCGAGWYLWQGKDAEPTATPSVPALTANTSAPSAGLTDSPAVQQSAQTLLNPSTSREQQSRTPAKQNADVQETPSKVLFTFHRYITSKEYRKAYDLLSKDFQASVSYEGWAPGFRTTVSSTVSDVKTKSQSENQVVLTYNLKAVDNPGGTQHFRGTAILIKTPEGWKIDDITNKTM